METKEFKEIIEMLKEIADELIEKEKEASDKMDAVESGNYQWHSEAGRFAGLAEGAVKIISARHEIENILRTFERDHCMIRVH